jgi:KUP system potassium uptake protein
MSADKRPTGLLAMVGALGVVFGDIGTSPLYAVRTILSDSGQHVDTALVYGMTSTVIWSLVIVVTVLYVGLLLGTDNEGEGGLLALLGLLRRSRTKGRTMALATGIAMVGAAMFLGDSVITPAISVLSASEGLKVASPSLGPAVLPIALAILVGVFVLQRVGSGRIGAVYGPVMVVWFAVLLAGGIGSLVQGPAPFQALSPIWAVRYFLDDPGKAFLSLGSVILVVTGAEALYADLGHFGRRVITRSWLFMVLPALVVGYLGEGAALLRDPSAASEPFYAVIPGWATIPVVVLATLATVIASEAVIAGAFTVLHQAGGLTLFPFLRTRHTSDEEGGRIYLPAANWALGAAVLLVVCGFRSSASLALTYGVAVSATILTTVTLFLLLQRGGSRTARFKQVVSGACLLVMVAFFAATVPKIVEGGWAPVGIGAVLAVVMWTWRNGQRQLAAARAEAEEPPQELVRELVDGQDLHRTPHTAVFLTDDKEVSPFALRTIVETADVLPARVVLLSWHVEDTPTASAHETTVEVDTFDDCLEGMLGVEVTLGYQERLSVQHVLETASEAEPERLGDLDLDEASYFVSDSIPALTKGGALPIWQQRLFLLLDRLATDRVEHLELPRDRTLVIGREFTL